MDGRVALVTGAGRGIGAAIARELSARGARLVLVARSEPELREVARETGAEYVAASVAEPEGCARAVEAARRLGPISILVNNAGVGSAGERPVWELERSVWERTLAVNLDGPFELTRLAARDMVAQGYGRIVMVSSTAGEVGGPAMAAYCASKAALLGLTRAVACDVGAHGVTCNAVCPGWVRTEMAERKAEQEAAQRGVTAEEIWAERAASYPAGRVVTPEEVARTVAFLASDASSGVNGEAVTVALGSPW